MTDHVGQQLGNYRLIRHLGRGSFADIYLGEHLRLETLAAIKVLHAVLVDDDARTFLHEAQTVARLKHPNIVRVYDFDVEDHIPFLVMDYLLNGNIRQHHGRGSLLPLSTIVSYIRQIADALQYAHDAQVIHRDIKPENMLLGQHNEVVLSDFGIALMAQSSRSQGTQEVAGTAAYMAPEQFRGKPRRASDQYALAVMVYEWMSGSLPFHGSFLEIASQHLFASPPPLREKIPAMPPAIEEVVLKALAKDPQERFSSVRAFANALEQAAQEIAFPFTPANIPTITPMSIPMAASENTPTNLITQDPSRQSSTASPETSPAPLTISPGMDTPSRGPKYPSQQPFVQSSTETEQVRSPLPVPPIHLTFRRGLSRSKAILLTGVVFLVIFGSVIVFSGTFTKWLVSTTLYPAATASPHLPVPVNYAMFGFDPRHTHFNPNEHALNPANVSQLAQDWTASTGAAIDSSPAIVNGVVYVGSGDHKLYAFNATTGRTMWLASTNNVIYLSSPAVTNGVVYVGSWGNTLYAFNATTGESVWTALTGDSINSSPAVVNGIVYVGSDDHKLYAFNATTGKAIWTASAGGYIASSPALANGVVYVGSGDHKLYAFNATTGKAIWTAQTGNVIYSSPAVANGVVYVGSWDSTLYAFNATTGKTLWLASTNDAIDSSPAVVNGVVYVGSQDHKLYAFRLLGTTP